MFVRHPNGQPEPGTPGLRTPPTGPPPHTESDWASIKVYSSSSSLERENLQIKQLFLCPVSGTFFFFFASLVEIR